MPGQPFGSMDFPVSLSGDERMPRSKASARSMEETSSKGRALDGTIALQGRLQGEGCLRKPAATR